MIRIAAAGDIHFDRGSRGRLAPYFPILQEKADLFLIAGDLTQTGQLDEVKVLAEELAEVPVPTVAVLGNHDYHMDQELKVIEILEKIGVKILEGNAVEFKFGETSVGVAGLKGFGGGFAGASGSDFGEREMKNFIRHTKDLAHRLENALKDLHSLYKIALLHYSPTTRTLRGEKKQIYPFLGSYLLAEVIDRQRPDMVFHGHAHKGIEKGETPGGIPVRNVAQPVIRHAFNIYTLQKNENGSDVTEKRVGMIQDNHQSLHV